MNKLILICLLFVVPTVFADTCANSVFATAAGLTPLTASVTSQDLSLCQGLKGTAICCSVDTINSLQDTVNTLVAETIVEAAARDTYLIAARAAVSAVSSTFKTLETNAKAAITKLQAAKTGEASATNKALYLECEEALQGAFSKAGVPPINVIYDLLEEGLAAEDDWSKFQEARATCANKVFEAQGSAYCLVCRVDPDDYATFTSNALQYTTDFKTAVQSACYPYFNYARDQNAITYPYIYLTNLASLNTLVASINSDITQATRANIDSLKTLLGVSLPTADYQELPDSSSCTAAGTCSYAYTTLLANGYVLDTAALANGGTIVPTASSSSSKRVLGEARTLAAVYDPEDAANTSGVSVDFPADPIAYLSAWRQGGLMTCVVALVAMLLF